MVARGEQGLKEEMRSESVMETHHEHSHNRELWEMETTCLDQQRGTLPLSPLATAKRDVGLRARKRDGAVM